jgi:hypothetical protein
MRYLSLFTLSERLSLSLPPVILYYGRIDSIQERLTYIFSIWALLLGSLEFLFL